MIQLQDSLLESLILVLYGLFAVTKALSTIVRHVERPCLMLRYLWKWRMLGL